MLKSFFRPRSSPRSQATLRGGQRRKTCLQLEQLEERRLLAGNVTITLVTIPQAVEGQLSSPALTASFTDTSGIAATGLTATIDYGDGTPLATATVSKIGTTAYHVTNDHTFLEESGSTVPPGAFNVTLHVFETATPATNTDTNVSQAQVLDAPLSPGNPVSAGTPQVFKGVGGTSTSGGALTALNTFETAIGGANNGGNAPATPLTTGFRDINWDGVNLTGTDFGGPPNTTVIDSGKTVAIPLNRFQERGVYFGAVYAVSTDAQSGGSFADTNANVSGLFTSFSRHNTFAMFNDNGIDFKFVLPSVHTTTLVSAASRGFGAIFINNQVLGIGSTGSSSIEYFHGATSLGKFAVPTGTPGQAEFLGVLFNDPNVTNVFITCGTDVIFRFDGTTFSTSGASDNTLSSHNLVVTDDFVYPEPVAIANGFPIVSGAAGTTNAAVAVTPGVARPFTGVVGTFSDADPHGNAHDYTATINWGDGHLTNGTITANAQGGFDVSGTNTYATPGRFAISVDVADFGGGPGLGGSNPTQSVTNTANVLDANHSFVQALFNDFLGRGGSTAELDGWVSQLAMIGQQGVANAIVRSHEGLTHTVDGFYVQFLGRAAQGGEEQGFVMQLQTGGTQEQVLTELLSSAEFAGHANSLPGAGADSNTNFVKALYTLLLHRAANNTEVNMDVTGLQMGVSRAAVAAGVLFSTEFRGDEVTLFAGTLLDRTSTPSAAEVAGWIGGNQDLLTIEAMFAGSAEYFQNG